MKYGYDVVVIGGGPGGYAAGIRASQLNAKVALLEPSEMGGTCVNRGCIPARIWNRAVWHMETIKKSSEFGVNATVNGIDFEKVLERRKGIPNDIQMGMQGLCKNYAIELIREKGVFIGPGEIQAGEKTITADKFIIATGTSLFVPDIVGLDEAAINTDEVLGMTRVPESILITGSGRIEIEMASLLSSLGAKVYLVFAEARILSDEDTDIAQRVSKQFRSKGIEIIPKAKLSSIEKLQKGFNAVLAGANQNTFMVEKVLVSSRKPNTDISLDTVGITLDDKGFIQIDEALKTTADNIFAIGDVTGGRQTSYAATCMGVIAAENAMGASKIYNPKIVPRGLWINPEVASVGLTEEEAEDLDLDIEVGECPISVNGIAMAYGQTDGAVKVISDAKLGEILGVHIIGVNATEMIWGASMAMGMEATVEDLAYNYAIHPTFSETIAMAAQDAMGWALYLPKSRK